MNLVFCLLMGRASADPLYSEPMVVFDIVDQMKRLLPYVPENRVELAEFAAKCGSDLHRAKQYPHAAKCFNEALAIIECETEKTATKPTNWLLQLSSAYIENDDAGKAAAALSMVSEDPRSLVLYVQLHLKARCVDEAANSYTQLLERPDCCYKDARTAAHLLCENLNASAHEGCDMTIDILSRLSATFSDKAAETGLDALNLCLEQCPDDLSQLVDLLQPGRPIHVLATEVVAGLQPLPEPLSCSSSAPIATTVVRGQGQLNPTQRKQVTEVLERFAAVASDAKDNVSSIAWLQLAIRAIAPNEAENAAEQQDYKDKLVQQISLAQINSGHPMEALDSLQGQDIHVTQLFLRAKALCSVQATTSKPQILQALVALWQHPECTDDHIQALAEASFSGTTGDCKTADLQRFVAISALLELADRKGSNGALMPLQHAIKLVALQYEGSSATQAKPALTTHAPQLVAIYNKALEISEGIVFEEPKDARDEDALTTRETAGLDLPANRELPQLIWLADSAYNQAIQWRQHADEYDEHMKNGAGGASKVEVVHDALTRAQSEDCTDIRKDGRESKDNEQLMDTETVRTQLLQLSTDLLQLSVDLRGRFPQWMQNKASKTLNLKCLLKLATDRVDAFDALVVTCRGSGRDAESAFVSKNAAAFKAIHNCRAFTTENMNMLEAADEAINQLALIDFDLNLFATALGSVVEESSTGSDIRESPLMEALLRCSSTITDSSTFEQLGQLVEQQSVRLCGAETCGSNQKQLGRVAEKAYRFALQHQMRGSIDFSKAAFLWRKIFTLTESPHEQLKIAEHVKQFSDKNRGKYPLNELVWFASKTWDIARKFVGKSQMENAKGPCEATISFLTSVESAEDRSGTKPSLSSPLQRLTSTSPATDDVDFKDIAKHLSQCSDDYEKLLSKIRARGSTLISTCS
jgi:hypothetical protein